MPIRAETTCGHCGAGDVGSIEAGYSVLGDAYLCHPNERGRPDCYRLVTVYHHEMPCTPCRKSLALGRSEGERPTGGLAEAVAFYRQKLAGLDRIIEDGLRSRHFGVQQAVQVRMPEWDHLAVLLAAVGEPSSLVADRRALGILVADQLNQLDLDEGCCEGCCAPCGDVLKPLIEAERLTDVVRQAPEHLWGPGVDWWVGDREDGHVDTAYVRLAWRCRSNPPCDTDNLEETHHNA